MRNIRLPVLLLVSVSPHPHLLVLRSLILVLLIISHVVNPFSPFYSISSNLPFIPLANWSQTFHWIWYSPSCTIFLVDNFLNIPESQFNLIINESSNSSIDYHFFIKDFIFTSSPINFGTLSPSEVVPCSKANHLLFVPYRCIEDRHILCHHHYWLD